MTEFKYEAYRFDEEDIVKTLDYLDIDGLITELEEDENLAETIPPMVYDMGVYNAYADTHYGYPEDMSELEALIDAADEAYAGEFSSWAAFAETMAEEFYEVPTHWPFNNIDWEEAGEDLKHDYMESDNHFFRNI